MPTNNDVRAQLLRIQAALSDLRPKQAVGEMVEHAISLCDAIARECATPPTEATEYVCDCKPEECTEHLGTQCRAEPAAPAASAGSLRDDQIREIVNDLRDIAVQYHDTQQLRERIARLIVPHLKAARSSSPVEAGAREAVYQLRLATGDWRDQDESSYRNNLKHYPADVRIVYAAPQSSAPAGSEEEPK